MARERERERERVERRRDRREVMTPCTYDCMRVKAREGEKGDRKDGADGSRTV